MTDSSHPSSLRFLPRTVVILGVVSLLNDAASEMITPLLPVFLTVVLGSGPAVVGLIEGLAESVASLLKFVSGRLADRGVPAKSLVLAGYGVSNVARPLIGLALGWSWVLVLRFLDRVGKGVRTAPRDAMIAASVEVPERGRAFGFHRSMDHAGAVIGPLLAYALLAYGVPLASVFFWSAVPGALLLILLLGLPRQAPHAPVASIPLRWRVLDARVRAMIIAAGGLALAAVPETFVVLWASAAGLPVAWVPLLWALASLSKMLTALPAGMWSDRIGRVPVLLLGLCARIGALIALALIDAQGVWIWLLFLAYSMSLAISEPAERSLLGDHAPPEQRGTAFGLYHLSSGVLALPGAFLFGLIWQTVSARAAFIAAAVVTLIATAGLMAIVKDR